MLNNLGPRIYHDIPALPALAYSLALWFTFRLARGIARTGRLQRFRSRRVCPENEVFQGLLWIKVLNDDWSNSFGFRKFSARSRDHGTDRG